MSAEHFVTIKHDAESHETRYKCCVHCEGNAVCAAAPDRHYVACSHRDIFDRYDCKAETA